MIVQRSSQRHACGTLKRRCACEHASVTQDWHMQQSGTVHKVLKLDVR